MEPKPSMSKIAPEVETRPVETMEGTAAPQQASQPAPTQQPEMLDIKISLSLHNIYEIRETEQTFRAKFFYMLSWDARDDPNFSEKLGGKIVHTFAGDGRHPHIDEKGVDGSGQEMRVVLRTLD